MRSTLEPTAPPLTAKQLQRRYRQGDRHFVRANLRGSSLRGLNLRDINLSQADLTGTCLKAWNIDSTTQLAGARCDYVYLLGHHQERRPNSGHFQPGEFTKTNHPILGLSRCLAAVRGVLSNRPVILSSPMVSASGPGS